MKRRDRSKIRGFIPTGHYPSAVAVAEGRLFVGNGKGTGFESSSTGCERDRPGTECSQSELSYGVTPGGQYIVSLIAGNISMLGEPDDLTLSRYTQQAMRNSGLIGPEKTKLFDGPSPIRHVIYVIKENRTYDQVFGDLERAGNGQPADGDPDTRHFWRRRGSQKAWRRSSEHRTQPSSSGAQVWIARSFFRELRGEPRRSQLVHGGLLIRLRRQSLSMELLGSRPYLRL